MISLLLHKSKAKLRMSVNNKDIIRMYLGYNWLISQRLLINAWLMELMAIAKHFDTDRNTS